MKKLLSFALVCVMMIALVPQAFAAKQELVVSVSSDIESKEWFQEGMRRFSEKHPKVEIVLEPHEGISARPKLVSQIYTGNAPDVFSVAIESDSADTIEGLGILPGRVKYTMMKRHNSFFLGTFDGMEVVGFKSLFGHTYGADDPGTGLFKVVRGVGRRPGSLVEGFRRGGQDA